MTQAQTNLEELTSSLYTILLTFTWGTGHVARFCKWTNDLVVNGLTFTAEPSIQIGENQQHGGTADAPMTITAKSVQEPFASLAKVEIMAKVKVKIQFVRVGDDSTQQDWFYGTVAKTVDAPSGQAGLVACTVVGIKARLKVLMGIQATTTCASSHLGDAMCKVDVDAEKVTANITGIDTYHVNLITTDIVADLTNERWKFGFVEVDGLRIGIRAVTLAGAFQLRDQPPAAWVGQSAVFTPGCDRQISTCRDIWNNEENFSGSGYAMPTHNPLFQTK